MSETEVTTEGQEVISDDLDAFATDFFGQKTEAPSQTKEEVVDAEETETEDNTEAQTDDEPELEDELPEEPPKKKTVQDRINELVRDKHETERKAAADLAALRQEFEDYKKSLLKPEPKASEQAEPNPADLLEDGETLKYPLGEFDPAYIRDLTRHTLAVEREKAQREDEAKQYQEARAQQQQTLQTQWNEKMTAAREEYPDLDEKGAALFQNYNDLPPDYAQYLANVLQSMDKGPDVLYYLANHPDEAATIINSGAQKATLALGRIESRFLQSEQEAPKPKVTKAPPPPPVRARGTNGAFIEVPPDTDDLDAFSAQFFRKKK